MNESEKDIADKVLIELSIKANEFIDTVFSKVNESELSLTYANATVLTILSQVASVYFNNVDEKYRKGLIREFTEAIEKFITYARE